MGSAALGLSAPVWGGVAILAGIPVIASMWNGVSETFDKDLPDLKSAIQELLSENPSQNEKTHLRAMMDSVLKMETAKLAIDSNPKDPRVVGQNAHKIQEEIKKLQKARDKYLVASRGLLPDFLSDFFSSINDRVDNVVATWEDFEETLSEDAKANAALLEGAGLVGPTGATPREPELDSDRAERVKTEPTTSKEERIAGMQRFLQEHVDSSVIDSGIMDQDTKRALDEFAELVSTDLGITNLDGVRLETEGNEKTLRRLLDIYRHPYKYQGK